MSSISTVKPPLTLPLILPSMVSSPSKAPSSLSQTRARLALSRERRVSPKPSSTDSSATCTASPTATSSSPCRFLNWLMGTIPSDFRPAFTTTASSRISMMVPVTMDPGLRSCMARLSSNNSAKLSVMLVFTQRRTAQIGNHLPRFMGYFMCTR